MKPPRHPGVGGFVRDVGSGAWDSITGGLDLLIGLTAIPDALDGNVGRPGLSDRQKERWGQVVDGVRHGVTNLDDFVAALVDWEGLKDNPARWIGAFAPDVAMSVVSGGGTAGKVARGLEQAEDGIDAATDVAAASRAADRVVDAAADVRRVAAAYPDAQSVVDRLRELPRGKSKRVRVAQTEEEIRSMFHEFTEGATPAAMENFDGQGFELADGSTIGLRESSKSGGLTIELRWERKTWKVHLDR